STERLRGAYLNAPEVEAGRIRSQLALCNARSGKWYGECRVTRIGIDRQRAARRARSRGSEDRVECSALASGERGGQTRTREAKSAAARRRARYRNALAARIRNRHGHALIASYRHVSKIDAARICGQRPSRQARSR